MSDPMSNPHQPADPYAGQYAGQPADPYAGQYAAPQADPYAGQYGAPQGDGPSGDDEPRNRGVLVALVGAAAVLALIIGGALFMRSRSTTALDAQTASASATAASGKAAATPTTVGGADVPTSVDTTVADTPTGDGSGSGSGSGSGNGSGNGSGGKATGGGSSGNAPAAPKAPPAAPAPSGPAPVINSFTTPENIDCHNGNDKMFSASWTTTNAVKTTIAIDGPGIYKTYGPNADDSLPFNCLSPHTFRLTAFGADGRTVTKTITLQPRNVQKPPTDDTEDETTPTTQATPLPTTTAKPLPTTTTTAP